MLCLQVACTLITLLCCLQVDAQAVMLEEDVKVLGTQVGALARLLLIADFLQEKSMQ
jgi:hypothetical protein